MEPQKIDFWTYLLISLLFILLAYSSYLAYKSIDWDVLKKLEAQKLVLPTPAISSPSAQIATPTATH